MKRFNLVALCVLMGFLAFGCGKKSGLEGKVVDGKGKPVANVKIIAKHMDLGTSLTNYTNFPFYPAKVKRVSL